ncbi:hypothetical protein ACFC1R_37000 [Kitasatospora sp. NPDC056138]
MPEHRVLPGSLELQDIKPVRARSIALGIASKAILDDALERQGVFWKW